MGRLTRIGAIAAAAALMSSTHASGDVYVAVQDGTAWQLNAKDQEVWSQRPEPDVVGAAFDGVGRLWLAQQTDDEGSPCVLTSPSVPSVTITTDDLAYPGGSHFLPPIDLCWLNTGPGTSLLTEATAGTLSATYMWQLNTETLALRYLGQGYSAAVGPRGELAMIHHTYYHRGGAWDALLLGSLASPGSVRRAVPAPTRSNRATWTWGAPAYSATGRLATIRDGRAVVGAPGGWSSVGPKNKLAYWTAWDSTGDLYVGTRLGGNALYRIPGGRPGPTEVWMTGDQLSGLAIGPDSPGAPLSW